MSDDWDKVTVIRKKPAVMRVAKDEATVNAARRSGGEIMTEKKFGGGANKHLPTDKNTAKLDRETEELHHEKVSLDLGKTIMKGRQDKQLSQKDLGVKINEKANVIADYEQGKVIPNQQILGKMERALGVKLRGKDIGSPLAPRGSSGK